MNLHLTNGEIIECPDYVSLGYYKDGSYFTDNQCGITAFKSQASEAPSSSLVVFWKEMQKEATARAAVLVSFVTMLADSRPEDASSMIRGYAEKLIFTLDARTKQVMAIVGAASDHERKAQKRGNDHERRVLLSGDESRCACDICEAFRAYEEKK